MKLESVRELKQSLFESAHSPVGDLVRAHAARVARGRMRRPTFALGVAHRGGGEFSLAVRLQHRAVESSESLEHIRRSACGEVDIRYIGRIQKLTAPWYHRRNRPLLMGSSIGHIAITAGTLGAFVRDRKTGAAMVLSNNHVLANENQARRGDAIVQPGPYDKGRAPADVAARLERFIRLENGAANTVDCAVGRIVPGVEFSPGLITGLGKVTGIGSPVHDGEAVAKVGRTTGLRRGRVTAFEVDNVVIGYDIGDLRFDNQIEIEGEGTRGFSAGGDSGSLIVNEACQAVALLFAGGDQGGSNGKGLTYGNPIGAVLDALGVDLIASK